MCMQRGRHTDGLVGVWMRMCCVHADEYKGKKKKTKNALCWWGWWMCWLVDALHVDVLACRCGCWWWACMSVRKEKVNYLMDGEHGHEWWCMWMAVDADGDECGWW